MASKDEIAVSDENPRYWQYDGETTLLLGGSVEDNLFQIPDLEAHLDTLAEAGGNYVRNTLSSREEFAVWPFAEVRDGVYDLDQWNDEYWTRLDRLLALTAEREIIPQFELWAFHDLSRQRNWTDNPWNPANNITYDADETSLNETVEDNYFGGELLPFFTSVPDANDDATLRTYQERFVDRVLESIEGHDHVLICITNEIFSQFPVSWSRYWVEYVRERTDAPVAEMFQEHDLTHAQHRESLDNPDRYDFVDISQNSRQSGDTHWERLQWVRSYITDEPRPINHVKTYGGERNWSDGPERGIRRFWRNVIGGAASTRFHRPDCGLGLNERAQRHIRSARTFATRFPFSRAQADVEHELLGDRNTDEAYCSFVSDEQYAVYFPDGGSVTLNLSDATGTFEVEWLHMEGSNWQPGEPATVDGGQATPLEAPYGGHWIALLTSR